jgi:uncharacterized membrane protein YhiD involved in acid resistance
VDPVAETEVDYRFECRMASPLCCKQVSMNFLQNTPSVAYPLTALEILLNIGLAFVLGIVITTVYRLTNRNQPVSPSFCLTLIMLSMVVALVMIIIGNSVARAFSLVGALSIIRFRTAVKDNRDIAFVFYALAAGMAAGVGNYPLAVYGIGLISLLLLSLDFVRFGLARSGTYLLCYQIAPNGENPQRVDTILKHYMASCRQLSVKTVRMGQLMQYTYVARLKKEPQLQEFVSELSAVDGIERVNMLSDEEEPEA